MRLWLFAAAVAAAFGCSEPTIQSPPPPMGTNVVYEDVPAPDGFTYVESYGKTSPTGAFRVATQTLRGNRRVENIVKFYKDAFPKHGWTLEQEEGAHPAPVKLAFAKRDERCRIEIKDESTSSVFIAVKINRKE